MDHFTRSGESHLEAEEPADPAPAPVEENAPPPPPPTDVPAPTAVPEPTEPPAPVVQKFFTEEFDGDLSNWDYFYFGDDEDGFEITPENGHLTFDIKDQYYYVYTYYTAQTYDDVRIEVQTTNRGFNNNNVSLICRYEDGRGWYEYNIANNGLYWLYAYDEKGDGYSELATGGSTDIKMGKETNEYAMVCSGSKLKLYINGVETKVYKDTQFGFSEGMIGVSVSSFDVVPINVEFEWIKIMEP